MPDGGNGFLEEIKLAYTSTLDFRKHLDVKTSSILSTSGATSTLLFGFGTFMITRIDPTYVLLPYAYYFLAAAVILSVASAALSFWAFKTENYARIMSETMFFRGHDFDEESIRRWESAEPELVRQTMVRDYLRCNRINNACNNIKQRIITIAQILLIGGGSYLSQLFYGYYFKPLFLGLSVWTHQ